MTNIWQSLCANVLSSLVLALLFFAWSDYVNTPPNLNGHWLFETVVAESSYNQYKGMKVTYEVTLLQNGESLSGFGEKTQDDVKGVITKYNGPSRIPIEISGQIGRNYLSKDTLTLMYRETGSARVSSTVQRVIRYNDNQMHGSFESTIAASKGSVDWRRY